MGYIISVKIENTDMYCGYIYANPAFPHLDIKNINNKNFFIPKHCDLDFEIKLDPRPVINKKILNKTFLD